jgi:hypothetical protein
MVRSMWKGERVEKAPSLVIVCRSVNVDDFEGECVGYRKVQSEYSSICRRMYEGWGIEERKERLRKENEEVLGGKDLIRCRALKIFDSWSIEGVFLKEEDEEGGGGRRGGGDVREVGKNFRAEVCCRSIPNIPGEDC